MDKVIPLVEKAINADTLKDYKLLDEEWLDLKNKELNENSKNYNYKFDYFGVWNTLRTHLEEAERVAKENKYDDLVNKIKGDNDITSTERNKILEIGYIDDSPELYLSSWRKLYYYQLVMDRLKSQLPFQSAKSAPDSYVKPLDIVRVCESAGENFTNFGSYGERSYGVMVRYHPIVAYKHSDKIIEHIAKVMGGEFDIHKNNCESFANKCVHNLDVSEHMSRMNGKCVTTVERKVVGNKISERITTSCGGGVFLSCPSDAFTSTEEFDRLSRNYYKENEIKGYVQSSSHFEGIKLEERIEVAPNDTKLEYEKDTILAAKGEHLIIVEDKMYGKIDFSADE
nr:1252_t:CDS:2 [Entrophospora candida]